MTSEHSSKKRTRTSPTQLSPSKKIAMPRAFAPDVRPAANLIPASIPRSIDTAIHVIASERKALENIENLYSANVTARAAMSSAVNSIARTVCRGNKLIVSGVGKSGKIGQKIVATMNSLGIQCCFLHPGEALHGDLGMIRTNDILLVISYSGKTQELIQMISHIPESTTLIAMTQHLLLGDCPLLNTSNTTDTILLPCPVHMLEEKNFGVSAPTTSTTVALAVGDALALAVANKIHLSRGKQPSEIFKKNHPGGAIGSATTNTGLVTPPEEQSPSTTHAKSTETVTPATSISSTDKPGDELEKCQWLLYMLKLRAGANLYKPVSELMEPAEFVLHPPRMPGHPEPRVFDILREAVDNGGRQAWMMATSDSILSPSRTGRLALETDPYMPVSKSEHSPIPRSSWVHVLPNTTVAQVLPLLKISSEGFDIRMSDVGFIVESQIIAVLDQTGSRYLGYIDAWDLFPCSN